MLYDLSPTIRPETPVWPGDTPFQTRLSWSLAEGASVNLSAITTTPHLGSHADAPFHTEPRGEGMAEMPLVPLLPAIASAIHDATGVWVTQQPITPERVLEALGSRQ